MYRNLSRPEKMELRIARARMDIGTRRY